VTQLHEHVAPGITLISADNLQEWLMDIQVLDDNPIYRGEVYRLKFVFSGNYPIGMVSQYRIIQTQTTNILQYRSTRSRFPQRRYTPNPHAPARLLEWHNLS